MNLRLTILTILAVTWTVVATDFEELRARNCYVKGVAAAGEAAAAPRQYAPDREVVMTHLKIDVTPDFKARTVNARTSSTCRIAGRPAQEIRLDAVDLHFRSVNATEKLRAWQATGQELILTFESALPTGKVVTVTAEYSATPRQGIYFRTPEMGYREGDTHLFSQGESIEARHWYPCLDAPNQMFTSEVICRVPEGMTVVSNGKLVSSKKDQRTGLVAFHWSQAKPHANYLVTLTAGYFKKIEGKYKEIPLAFYTPASLIDYAAPSFENTASMMEYFEQEIGVPYPWNKYDQICVNDFVAGGMENTSATTLTDSTLFSPATETINNSDGLVAHELAHQWFGDLVTCKDWSHLWLNEGFATYYETLYEGHKHGKDALIFEMYNRSRQITGSQSDTPIVRRTYDSPDQMFNFLSYGKGSWVLHMLRAQLGEELYRKCVKELLTRNRHRNVVTEDFRKIIQELSHRNFDRFFDQWLYHGGSPKVQVDYSWDELQRLATISVRQTHAVTEKVLLFEFPLPVRFKGKFGVEDRVVNVSRKEQEFIFVLPSAPESVRFDPEVTVLCEITTSLPATMIEAQLADSSDVIGRLQAMERLANKRDPDAIAKLKSVLNNDSFHGVRTAASRHLGSIRTDEALTALLDSVNQPDARVRNQVASDIGSHYNMEALAAARELLAREKNPAIIATALSSLAGYSDPEIYPLLLSFMGTSSFRNEIALAAISAIGRQRDARAVPSLIQVLSTNQAAFSTRGYARALAALPPLGREMEDNEVVLQFLLTQASSSKRFVRLAAIQALGSLGNQRAEPVLEKFATAGNDTMEYRAAERALSQLRGERKSTEDLQTLRREVLELQKQQKELRSQIDERKKAQAATPAARGGSPASNGKAKSVDKSAKNPALASPKQQKPGS